MLVPSFSEPGVPHLADFNFLLTPPQGAAYQNTPQAALTNNVATLVTFDTLWFDTDPTMWAIGNPSRLVINTPGKWLFIGTVLWNANATAQRSLDLRKNAAGSSTGGTRLNLDLRQAAAGGSTTNTVTVEYPGFVAGDYVEMFALQQSGGALALFSNNYVGAVSLQAKWMGV